MVTDTIWTDHRTATRWLSEPGEDHAVTNPLEAMAPSGCDFEVEKRALYYPARTIYPGALELMRDPNAQPRVEYRELARHQVSVRSDTGSAFGPVGKGYCELQNRELFELAASLGLTVATAGALDNGRRVWLLCYKGSATFEPVRGDAVKQYVCLSTTHDGSGAVHIFDTDVRIVCRNTFRLAHRDARNGTSIRHTASLPERFALASDQLHRTFAAQAEFREVAARLARVQVSANKWTAVLDGTIPLTDVGGAELPEGRARTTRENKREELTRLFEAGVGQDIPGVRGTGWAALNAFTQWSTHAKATRTQEGGDSAQAKRLEALWFGAGSDLPNKAAELLLA